MRKKCLYYLPGDEVWLESLRFRIVCMFNFNLKKKLLYSLLCITLKPESQDLEKKWYNHFICIESLCGEFRRNNFITISEDLLLQEGYNHKRDWCIPSNLPGYSFCINLCNLREYDDCTNCPIGLNFKSRDTGLLYFPGDEVFILDDQGNPSIDSKISGVYIRPKGAISDLSIGKVLSPFRYDFYFRSPSLAERLDEEELVMLNGGLDAFDFFYSVSGYNSDIRDSSRIRLKYKMSRANIIVPYGYKRLCDCCIKSDCKGCSLKDCNG